jgi:hypothetical protein
MENHPSQNRKRNSLIDCFDLCWYMQNHICQRILKIDAVAKIKAGLPYHNDDQYFLSELFAVKAPTP